MTQVRYASDGAVLVRFAGRHPGMPASGGRIFGSYVGTSTDRTVHAGALRPQGKVSPDRGGPYEVQSIGIVPVVVVLAAVSRSA